MTIERKRGSNRSQSAWILNRYAALVSVICYVKENFLKGEFTMQLSAVTIHRFG